MDRDPGPGAAAGEPALEVGRSLGAKLRAGLGAGLALWLLGGALAAGWSGMLLLGLLLLAVSTITLASAFGDRFRLDHDGVRYRNRWLRWAPFAPREVRWDEIESLRRWRGRVLIVEPRRGPRLVLDSIEHFAEVDARLVAGSGLSARLCEGDGTGPESLPSGPTSGPTSG